MMEGGEGLDVTDMKNMKLDEENGMYHVEDTEFDPVEENDALNDSVVEPSVTEGSVVKTPAELAWKDLSYTVNGKKNCFGKVKESKDILHGISGRVEPGQMLAIMGSSGAGKTTLLNLLAGRLTTAGNVSTSGEILLNNKKRNFAVFKMVSGCSRRELKLVFDRFCPLPTHSSVSMRLKGQGTNSLP